MGGSSILIIILLIISILIQFIILSKLNKDSFDEKILRQYFDNVQSKIEAAFKDEIRRIREENYTISFQTGRRFHKTY